MLRAAFALATLLVCLLSATTLMAQTPVSIQASTDTDRVTVGDRINLTVIIQHAPDIRVEPPQASEPFGDLEVIQSLPPQESVLADGSKEVRLRYVVVAFRTGALALTLPPIAYVGSDGAQRQATAQSTPIQVESVLPADQPVTDIRGLKPQLTLPGESTSGVQPVIIGAAVAAGALLLLRLYLRRRRARPQPQPAPLQPVDTSAEDRARAEFDRIADLDLIAQGLYKDYYGSIALCVRRYLTERYGFPAVALTTPELEDRMVQRGLDRWQARLVGGLLAECDAVVYARYTPAPARAEATLTMAYEVTEMASPTAREPLAPSVEG